jgi:hypothetical protein
MAISSATIDAFSLVRASGEILAVGGNGAGRPKVRAPSHRCGEKSDREGEQHEAAECVDRYVYRTDHWKRTQLITIGSDDGLNGRLGGRRLRPGGSR